MSRSFEKTYAGAEITRLANLKIGNIHNPGSDGYGYGFGSRNGTDTPRNRSRDTYRVFESQMKKLLFDHLMNLRVNLFKYTQYGKPLELNTYFMETTLASVNGVVGITKNNFDELVLLPQIPFTQLYNDPFNLNYTGRSTSYFPLSKSLAETYNINTDGIAMERNDGKWDGFLRPIFPENPDVGDFVTILNKRNWTRTPETDIELADICATQMAQIYAMSRNTRQLLRTPYLIEGDFGELDPLEIPDMIFDGQLGIQTDSIDGLKKRLQVLNLQIPNLMPQFKDEINNWFSFFLNTIGANSLSVDKKERVNTADSNANNQSAGLAGNVRLAERREAFDLVGKRWPEFRGIEVNYNLDAIEQINESLNIGIEDPNQMPPQQTSQRPQQVQGKRSPQ